MIISTWKRLRDRANWRWPDLDIVLTKVSGRLTVTLQASKVGNDLLVLITGGKSHIGAVGAGNACGGLASSSVITMPGHRDDRIVKESAEKLSKVLGCNCVVVGGVHFDNITRQEIDDIISLCGELIDDLEGALRTGK